MNGDLREKAGDLWFALCSDRFTLACYRDIRQNKKALRILIEDREGRR